MEDLYRYFVGSSIKLTEPNYISIPNNFNVNSNKNNSLYINFNYNPT